MKKSLSKIVFFFPALLLTAGLAYASDFHMIKAGGLTVQVSFGKTVSQGKNDVTIALAEPSGKAVTDALVRLYWEMPAMGTMPAMKYHADAALKNGAYHVAADIPMCGTWNCTVKIKRGGKLLPPAKFSVNAE